MLPRTDVVLTTILLALHLTVPASPFGSWDARGRVDPRGDWRRPAWSLRLSLVVLCLVHLVRFALDPFSLAAPSPGVGGARFGPQLALVVNGIGVLFALLLAATLALPRARASAWIALTLWQLARIAAFGPMPGDGALLLLHAFAADPGWWPGRRGVAAPDAADAAASPTAGHARLYYDGDCGFCHRSVRVVLAEERATPPPLRLRFAPLGSEIFAREVAGRDDVDADALPDSIVLVLEDGRLLTRSAAALEIASRLGGLWLGLARLARLVPRSALDAAYDAIARVRKRLFASPKDACPILPPELRARFDA